MEAWLSWDGLGHVADALSLVTALISGYAAWKIRSVSRRMVFMTRSDALLERMAEAVRILEAGLMQYPENDVEILASLRPCLALLYSNHGEFSKDLRKIIGQLKHLEKRLHDVRSEVETSTEAGLVRKQQMRSLLGDILIELQCALALARDLVLSRRLGGGDA